MNRFRLVVCLVLSPPLCSVFGSSAHDTLPEAVRELELTEKVTGVNYIHITGRGDIGVSFDAALGLLDQKDLLTTVQEAYIDLLDEGEKPEFVIKLEKKQHYSYVNRKKQRTDIVEIHRAHNDEGGVDLVLYTKGKRSFGPFQALTHVRVKPDAEREMVSLWEVQVFAYPENGFSRFFARNFGIAERYFRNKTADISLLATDICRHLLTTEEDARTVEVEKARLQPL